MLGVCKLLRTVPVAKHSHVLARPAKEGEEVVTITEEGKPEEFFFVSPWGETMPVAEDDVLIVMEGEVYRIARASFDQTYQFA